MGFDEQDTVNLGGMAWESLLHDMLVLELPLRTDCLPAT
jgi:hypothetical protein